MENEIPIGLVLQARDEMTTILDQAVKETEGLTKATEKVSKESDDASDSFDGLAKSEKKSADESSSLKDKLESVGDVAKTAGKIIAGAAAAIGAAFAAVGAAAVKTIADTNEWAGTLDSLGDVLGTNANESAALAVAIKGVGGDVNGITSQMVKLTRGLQDNNGKASETAKLMQSLGIAYKGANGEMLPAGDIIQNTANALAKMPDGLEKTSIMTQLFGRSGKDLGDTMNALANGGLAAAEQKAKDFGLLIGDNGVNNTIEFGKKTAELQQRMQGFSVSIGNAIMPAILPFLDTLNSLAAEYLPKIGAALTPIIQAFVSFAQENIPKVVDAFKTVFDWVQTNWPVIRQTIEDAFAAIQSAVDTYVKPAVDFYVSLFNDVAANTGENFSDIEDLITNALATVEDVITKVVGIIGGIWDEHGQDIMNTIREVWTYVSDIVTTAVAVVARIIEIVFGQINDYLVKHGEDIKTTFTVLWDGVKIIVGTALDLIKGALQALLQFLNGDFIGAWETLKTMMKSIWDRIYDILKEPIDASVKWINETMTTLGNDIEFAVNSIKNRVSTVWQQLRDDTIERFRAIKQAIIDALRTAITYYNTVAPFMRWMPIMLPDMGAANRGSRGSAGGAGGGSTANVTVNVYGGDAATAERGVVAGLQRAGFAILR